MTRALSPDHPGQMTGSVNLKPCPFCGGSKVEIVKRDVEPQGDTWYGTKEEIFVECCDCGATKFNEWWHEGFADNARAAESWNTRASCWQPIETAPKDGTEVDLWCVDKREGYAPRRLTQRRYGRMSNWVGEEVVGWNIGNPYRDWRPTHWMPLPLPPEPGGEG